MRRYHSLYVSRTAPSTIANASGSRATLARKLVPRSNMLTQQLPQSVADDLARSGARDRLDQMHRVRNLVGGQLLPAMREQRVGLDRLPVARHHEQRRHFAERVMRHADHRAIE